jgi:hypothetical protein
LRLDLDLQAKIFVRAAPYWSGCRRHLHRDQTTCSHWLPNQSVKRDQRNRTTPCCRGEGLQPEPVSGRSDAGYHMGRHTRRREENRRRSGHRQPWPLERLRMGNDQRQAVRAPMDSRRRVGHAGRVIDKPLTRPNRSGNSHN